MRWAWMTLRPWAAAPPPTAAPQEQKFPSAAIMCPTAPSKRPWTAPRPWKRWSPWTVATCCPPRDARPFPAWTACSPSARIATVSSWSLLASPTGAACQICRGMQVMNVALGGSLYRDLYNCGVTEKQHRQNPPYCGISHQGHHRQGQLAGIGGDASGDFEVNSMHHQGVDRSLTCSSQLVPKIGWWKPWKIPRSPSSWAFSGIRNTSTAITACSTPWLSQPTTATRELITFCLQKLFSFWSQVEF